MKTLLLIDANSLIHRFYHALPPLTGPNNEPVGALYGLSKVLLKILREKKPAYAVAAFDRKEKTFRSDLSEEYKATRPPTADDLIPQLQAAPHVFETFGIKAIDKVGYEADDIIGTLAEKFKNSNGVRVVILTGDMDALQLVEGNKVVVDAIKKGIDNLILYDAKKVEERYGLGPEQLTDYKGLVGDPSDNIKGVPGVGPKTATELLKEHGTIEQLFEDIAIVPEKMAKKLEGQEGQAKLSKKLATIVRDVPLGDISLNDIQIEKLPKEQLAGLFNEYGFSSLVKSLDNGN